MGFFSDKTDWEKKTNGRDKEPRVLKRQPTVTEQVVVQVESQGGAKFDICANCKHWTGKPVTNMTRCRCCQTGHLAGEA
jgi:hypothetical protein